MLSSLSLALVLLASVPVPQEPTPKVEWQRSLADALALQKATGKPLLICVNADGETFCERFANDTYLDEKFVATTRGYICVIASPDHHNGSDYDGRGRRIECPRFPGCTCSEHINIEPELFARWFKNERYAPRHVAVAADGTVIFDHFLDRSMQDAVADIEKHKGPTADDAVPTDAAALFARRDAASRRALEQRYRDGDRAARLGLLAAAAAATNEPLDLLRQALRDDDDAIFAAAARALAAQTTAEASIDLQDALARADAELEAPLLAAITALGASDPFAARFVAHRRAAVTAWQRATAEPWTAPVAALPTDRTAIDAALDAAEEAVRAMPTDGKAIVQLALADLDLALFLRLSGDSSTPLWFEDARRTAERAAAHAGPAELPAVHAVQAIALREQGKDDPAQKHAEAALAAIAALGKDFDAGQRWLPPFLAATAASASAAAYGADGKAIVADAVAAAATAYARLVALPSATASDANAAAALLGWAGARQQAQQLLLTAIANHPADRELHDALRQRLLADRGPTALRAAYQRFLAAATDQATAAWFAGYAALVAAESHTRDREPELAIAAYCECIAAMQASAAANADYKDSADHFAVLALAGRALQHHLRGAAKAAVDDLLAARALRPATMSEKDGLGRVPDAILRRVRDELRERGETAEAARLGDS